MAETHMRDNGGGDPSLYRAWLEVTLRSIGDAVIATDPAARVTFMNPTAEGMTGWSEAEAKGRPLSEVFNIVNEDTRKLVMSPVDKALREGAIVGLANHTLLIARDGTERPIDDSAAPIWDEAGTILGVVMVFHDITERREAERRIEFSETRFRRLFESARDGILIVDRATRKITEANPFMEELLETSRSELIGRELWQIGLIKDEDEARRAFETLLDKGYIRYEDLPLMSSSGLLRDVEFVSNVYQEDGHSVIQCNVRDITERKRLTEQREEALELAKQAQAAAEAADRAKDVFLATLSHELRTPLNAILGWAVMLRTSGKCDNGDVAVGIGVIERNARAQGKLIEDVLDIARIVAGKFTIDPRPCDLAALAHAAADLIRPAADAKQLKVELDIGAGRDGAPAGLWVMGEPARLQQVLGNLLANAVKFTPKGGRIGLRLERREAMARVVVSDTGRGIAPEFLPFVFDRFRQADQGTTRVFGGLGLGLSIVRQITQMHGGTVVAASEGSGRGATFTLEFPVRVGDAPDRPAPVAAESPRLDGLRFLVIDDEADALDLARMLMEGAGASVGVAASASDGFRLAVGADPPFDALLCDIGMPLEDGFSLVRRLRSAGLSAKTLPAVAMTAFASAQDKRKALLAGFQAHVAKPIEPQELLAVLAGLVGRLSEE